MNAASASSPAREFCGPFTRRECAPVPGGYQWIEHVHGHPIAYFGDGGLAQLSAIAGTADVRTFLPSVPDGVTAYWPTVSTPSLMFDRLLTGGVCPDEIAALGRFLAELHRVSADPELPRRNHPPWLLADPPMNRKVSRIRAELRDQAGPLIVRYTGMKQPEGPVSVVHGRFSTALCAMHDGGIGVLGWREAGQGDPMQDLGYVLGELAEATAVRRTRVPLDALLDAYQNRREVRLSGAERHRLAWWSAARVLDHMAVHVIAYRRIQGPTLLLRNADPVLTEVLEAGR